MQIRIFYCSVSLNACKSHPRGIDLATCDLDFCLATFRFQGLLVNCFIAK